MQNAADRRCEPRLSAGQKILVLSKNGADWKSRPAFTVNVSEHGILVTIGVLLRPGDRVRLQSCEDAGCWADAIVRHVIPGTTDYLTGMQFVHTHGGSLLTRSGGMSPKRDGES